VIYVKAVLELLASGLPVHGLAHITGGGLTNLRRLAPGRVGYAIESPLPVPAVLELIGELGKVPEDEMWEVFNMGCGLVVVVDEADVAGATAILASHHPGAARVGTVTDRADETLGPGGIVVGGN
jgi:phosphoribosylformylglycinamidine cyclo-ligase